MCIRDRCKTDRENYEKYWDDINPFIKFGCLKDEKFDEKMKDYILYKNLDGKYLTLADCLEENKEKHENKIFYVTDEKEQSQYINCLLYTSTRQFRHCSVSSQKRRWKRSHSYAPGW